MHALDAGERSWLSASIAYPEDTVGHLMTRELVSVRDADTIGQAIGGLRLLGELPDHTDRIFVVDSRNLFKGTVLLQQFVLQEPRVVVGDLAQTDTVTFAPEDAARLAAGAFERYDLLSAAVVDDRGKLLGRLKVDTVLDFIREQADTEALQRAGLSGEEDLFAPVWDSTRNRSPWLFINLVTAFLASRVIGFFSGAIEQFVALATLMPIVASVGGNTGNQTIALVTRALALGQVEMGNSGQIFRKELRVAAANGIAWGAFTGLVALMLYGSVPLGLVMMAAVGLNLLIAALVGVVVPLALQSSGRDPARGSSVLLTFLTDAVGFFLFLGLAQAFLI